MSLNINIHKTLGIVLRREDVRQTSLRVVFFTRDFGKINSLVKAARASAVKYGSHIEPVSLNDIVFYEKRHQGLHLVTQCNLVNNFPLISTDMKRLSYALYFMELVDVVSPLEQRNGRIFSLLVWVLERLKDTVFIERLARIFEIKLLDLIGIMPRLDACVYCGREVEGQTYFQIEAGGVICRRHIRQDNKPSTILPGTIASIVHIRSTPLERMLNFSLSYKITQQLEELIGGFLRYHLAKEINTRKYLSL